MEPYFDDGQVTLWLGDALEVLRTLPDGSVSMCCTSPPYYSLRDYGEPGQYGLESSPAEYVETMRAVFAEVRRVLADDGTLWLNLGDSYAANGGASGRLAATGLQGTHPRTRPEADNPHTHGRWLKDYGLPVKNLLGVPWRVAFALQDDGWILRSDIIWAKPSPMPEAVRDRPTSAHEHVFLFAKSARYHYDADAIAEQATGQSSGNGFVRPEAVSKGGRGRSSQWEGRPQLRRALQIARDKGLTEAHFAAIRSVGMNDAGKARLVQSGSGQNAAEVQRLADEAKDALGGYYREFLTGATRNARNVWTFNAEATPWAHFAVMPRALAERCIKAGCKPGGTVLDPFAGSGTTGMVALRHGAASWAST